MHENVYQQLWNIVMGKQMMKIWLKSAFKRSWDRGLCRERKTEKCSTVVPDDCMCTDDKLGSRVPLVIGYIVVRLKPDPLLTFSQEAVITRLPFSILHHWTEERAKMIRNKRDVLKKKIKGLNARTYSVHDTLRASLGHPHGNSHTLMFPKPQKVSSLWLAELWKWEILLSNKSIKYIF